MTNVFIVALVAIVGMMAIVLLNLIPMFIKRAKEQEEAMQGERAAWQEERKQLMDRIQAGSYAELKQQEIRVIKAGKQEAAPVFNYSHLE